MQPTPRACCACFRAARIASSRVWPWSPPRGAEVAAEVTAVSFFTLSDAEIADYVAGGEPMDKAGAYAIQGRAARWIPRIEGCYFNVMGLPLALVCSLLEPQKGG